MSEVQLWSDVAVDVQTALAAPKTITAITKASPAVASSVAHGYADGDVLLLKVKGMIDLDYAVVRVDGSVTDAFSLEGIDSTLFGDFVSGTAEKITFGASAATFTEVNAAGGESADVLVQTIHVRRGYNMPGNETPLVFTFGSLWVTDDPALVALKAASRARAVLAVRFTFSDGTLGLFAGVPAASMVPNGSAGALVTTPVKINVRGLFQDYAGA
ncbi:phage tail tube protein [Variovorax paradoxus]|uniref:phage tail tube protein n=1 Tax=Variovorax paradoxus TaxID=34073 RepID=UPI00040BB5B5